ncbi:hypothetical protein AM587_10004846 [Phytophthora nicotianae]|uniref:Uncharacterized protein n=1 Tax=Phytophthora nicotianae TaxID=4792 RepID=A0A0W8CWQ7_PHYNI|nr:hypothetical protein AM587_10004846 [Phytophthora nicotianae]
MSETLAASQPTNFTPKQIAAFFFKPFLTEDGDPTGFQICKACVKTHKHTPKTGYIILVSHVKSVHPRFQLEMEDASIAATGSLLPWVRQKASNRYTKLPPVCRNTLRANMESVTKAGEKKIADEMPDKFGLLLDGWSHGTEHYLGVFACYETPSAPNADIVAAPQFESAVIKVLGGTSEAAFAR